MGDYKQEIRKPISRKRGDGFEGESTGGESLKPPPLSFQALQMKKVGPAAVESIGEGFISASGTRVYKTITDISTITNLKAQQADPAFIKSQEEKLYLGTFSQGDKVDILQKGTHTFVFGTFAAKWNKPSSQYVYIEAAGVSSDNKAEQEFLQLVEAGDWAQAAQVLLGQSESFAKAAVKKIRKISQLKSLRKAVKKTTDYEQKKPLARAISGIIKSRHYDIVEDKAMMSGIQALSEEDTNEMGGKSAKHWRDVAKAVISVSSSSKYLSKILLSLETRLREKATQQEKIHVLEEVKEGLDGLIREFREKHQAKKISGKSLEKVEKSYQKAIKGVEDRLAFHRGHGKPDANTSKESTSINATGSYFSHGGSLSERASLQLNQAGYYVKGYLQYRRGGQGKQKKMEHHFIEGMISESTKEVLVINHTREDDQNNSFSGEMRINRKGNITMIEGGNFSAFKRHTTEAYLSDQAIFSLPNETQGLVYGMQREPLDPGQKKYLESFLTWTKEKVQAYFAAGHGIPRNAIASSLNQHFGNFRKNFTAGQQALVKKEVYVILNAETFAPSNPDLQWSYLRGLQSISQQNASDTPEIRKIMGLKLVSPGEQLPKKYKYEFETTMGGGDIDVIGGVSIMAGTIKITKKEPNPKETFVLGIATASVGSGPSLGMTVFKTTGTTDLESAHEWRPENFIGPMTSVGISGGIAVGPGMSMGYSSTFFEGDGTHTPIEGHGMDVDLTAGISVGAGVEITEGYIGKDLAAAKAFLKKKYGKAAKSQVFTGTKVHFEVNKSTLTPEGIQAIRWMCADNLANLRSPKGNLRVDGYTSTTAEDEHNEKLSWDRAYNTLETIRSILDKDLQITDTKVKGHGETAAKQAGEKEDSENSDWRKVEVSLNGHLVLKLR